MRRSRRVVMYAVVGAQLLVLASIVAPQELNMALDPGGAVDLEVVRARAERDSFRGAMRMCRKCASDACFHCSLFDWRFMVLSSNLSYLGGGPAGLATFFSAE